MTSAQPYSAEEIVRARKSDEAQHLRKTAEPTRYVWPTDMSRWLATLDAVESRLDAAVKLIYRLEDMLGLPPAAKVHINAFLRDHDQQQKREG